uniref:WW domain-binding protein 11 n=1 Tax=Globodera rostochiensis TaxID=31243 RepID=A0A914GVF9_GLORO
MGKRSGLTKSGRVMNPADRERKQQRAKELKRNKKQRTMVRHAIVKGRNPEELIELMSRLDDQEFDPHRELSLNVIQEKRHKMRGSFFQVVNLYRQEKDEKRVKHLEKMLVEYELERSKKEENFRAQLFSETANFEDIPLPMGAPGAVDASKTPFLVPPAPGMAAAVFGGVPMPSGQLQAAMRAGILKKTTTALPQKRHKHPPGPPPGLPPPLLVVASSSDSEGEEAQNASIEDGSGRRRIVRFSGDDRSLQHGNRRREKGGGRDAEEEDGDGSADDDHGRQQEEEEDYAPVEIPDSMLAADALPPPQHQAVYARAAPPVMPPLPQMPSMGGGRAPLPPGMAPPPPNYPPGYYAPNMPPEIHAQALRTGRMPPPNLSSSTAQQNQLQQQQQSKTGLITYTHSDPHPSAVISAAPQVVKPSVNIAAAAPKASSAPGGGEAAIISASPQMRNIRRESTRFVPTAVKIQRPLVKAPSTVPATSGIGPRVPTTCSAAGRTVPKALMVKQRQGGGTAQHQKPSRTKTTDEACDDFLRELEGLL